MAARLGVHTAAHPEVPDVRRLLYFAPEALERSGRVSTFTFTWVPSCCSFFSAYLEKPRMGVL